MPSERTPDQADEISEEREAAAGADEASEHDDVAENDEEEESSESRILIGSPNDEQAPVDDSPRNRAERRLAKKREIRGAGVDRNARAAERAAEAVMQVRVPPKTISGKSSADEVPPWAKGTVSWMSSNKGTLIAAGLAVAVGLGGSAAWLRFRERKFSQATDLYQAALEMESAPIRAADAPADPPGSPPRHGPTYTDRTARAQAALRGFRAVSDRFGSTPMAPLAKLSEASELYDLGRFAEARTAFESVLGKDVGGQEGRVFEGLGFTLEALNDLDGALHRYDELGRLSGAGWRDIAAFHQARVLQRQSHADRAKDLLHGVIERLRHAQSPDDVSAVGGNGSILEQSQALLRDIDPLDPLAHAAVPTAQDPDALMRMIEQQTGHRLRVQHPAPAGSGTGAPSAPVQEGQ